MSIVYCETDPISSRWTGVNRLLTAFEVDYNFYQHETRIAALESGSDSVGISYIVLHGDQLTFHMTDHTTQGPFTVPLTQFRDRGTWLPFTNYSINDTFSINGTLYLVIFNHTSQATFSAGANDGLGHDYYSAMITTPGSSLPTGGATNQVLSKSSSADFAVTWSWKLPIGGTTGQILTKNSSTNQDASWDSFPGVISPPPSPAGVAGEALATRDGTTLNMEWIKVVYSPSSNAAFNGEVLATIDGTNFNTEWVSVVYAPAPSPAGAANQGLVTSTGSAQHMEWQTLVFAPPPSPAGVAGQFLATVDGTPENMEWVTPNTDSIEFVIDGGGSVLTTGMKGYVEVPRGATITSATLLADQSGSVIVDIFKCTYSQFDAGSTHPVSGDKITASAPPTITSTYKSQDTTLSGWTKTLNAGDILAFNVNSITTITRVTISLKIK